MEGPQRCAGPTDRASRPHRLLSVFIRVTVGPSRVDRISAGGTDDGENGLRRARPLGLRARGRPDHALLPALSGGTDRDRAALALRSRDHLPGPRLPRAGRRRPGGDRMGLRAPGRRRDQPGRLSREYRDVGRRARAGEPGVHGVEPAPEPRGDGIRGAAASTARRAAAHVHRADPRAASPAGRRPAPASRERRPRSARTDRARRGDWILGMAGGDAARRGATAGAHPAHADAVGASDSRLDGAPPPARAIARRVSQPGACVPEAGHPTTSDADGRGARPSNERTWSMRKAGRPGGGSGATGGGGEWTVERRDPASDVAAAAPKDYDIVVAMRRGEAVAFEQFVARFHRVLLDYARRAGVAPMDRDELVS